jgi:hypothetical protein
LAEVGAEGQARIGRLAVDLVIDGFAADVAARYLAGAGVAAVRVRDGALAATVRAVDPAVGVAIDERVGEGRIEAPAVPLPLRDPAARELARGASFALDALRTAALGAR